MIRDALRCHLLSAVLEECGGRSQNARRLKALHESSESFYSLKLKRQNPVMSRKNGE